MNNYAELRAALEAGPTPGPWKASQTGMRIEDAEGRLMYEAEWRPAGARKANAVYIAACHHEAIRALLAERDALLDQHHRDSKELRRLCAQRDAARKVSKEAGAVVAGLKAERDALREALLALINDDDNPKDTQTSERIWRAARAALAQGKS